MHGRVMQGVGPGRTSHAVLVRVRAGIMGGRGDRVTGWGPMGTRAPAWTSHIRDASYLEGAGRVDGTGFGEETEDVDHVDRDDDQDPQCRLCWAARIAPVSFCGIQPRQQIIEDQNQ